MKIHTLRCGSMRLPTHTLTGGSALSDAAAGLFSPAAARTELPVNAYLVEHPRGLLLVDTGWPRELFPGGQLDPAAAKRLLPGALRRYYAPALPVGASVGERLSAMGIAPGDLDCVLVTHLDPDHVGGLRQVSGAKRLLVCEEERFWSCRTVFALRQPAALWQDTPPEIFYARGSAWGPIGRSHDLFGDGSVLLIRTPGFTQGQCSVLLRQNGRQAVICSDIVFSDAALTAGRMAGHMFNEDWGRRSLRWLAEVRGAPDCVACLINHDPDAGTAVVEF